MNIRFRTHSLCLSKKKFRFFWLWLPIQWLFVIANPLSSLAQSFYHIDTIQKIEISFSQSNWDYILDTAKLGSDSYTLSQWVKINGVVFDSAGVKYKGNSSFNPSNLKNPFHIELDHFKNHNYQGFTDIKLSNGFNEPSFIRETLIYEMSQKYMHAPRANFAQVYVNGQYNGLYTNVEAITKRFVNSRFNSKNNAFFFADNGGCNLVYKGPDSTLYYNPYTKKSVYGYDELRSLCNTLKNNVNNIESELNVDRALWHIAYLNALVILDSYIGQSTHNYYIYKDDNGRFNPIIWDLNGAFGTFSNPGNGPAYTIPQMQNMSPMLHSNDSMWPMINKLLNVPRYRKMYVAHMKTIVSENFANNTYYTRGKYMQSIIDTAVQSDPYKFFTYANFLSNIDNNVISGPKNIPGIAFLMNARTTFLNNTPDFQAAAPVITQVQPSDTFPLLGSGIFITAKVTNASEVFLGRRFKITDRFNRIQMFDNGLNGDGAAGDGVYGAPIPVNSTSIQYYIYADNNLAGMFSPVRAEHEYYTLKANYMTVLPGQVTINEIMALNKTTVQTAGGFYSDWIELYNNTAQIIELDYLHLSDDQANHTKWRFPAGTTIAPFGYKIIWADKGTGSGELHCSFRLSGAGEQVYLSYDNGTVVDSLTYGAQTDDISFGRYPNGTGPFTFMPPTFNAVNIVSGVYQHTSVTNGLMLYPNPSDGALTVVFPEHAGMNQDIEIYNTLGKLLIRKGISTNRELINLGLKSGIYFVRAVNSDRASGMIKLIVN